MKTKLTTMLIAFIVLAVGTKAQSRQSKYLDYLNRENDTSYYKKDISYSGSGVYSFQLLKKIDTVRAVFLIQEHPCDDDCTIEPGWVVGKVVRYMGVAKKFYYKKTRIANERIIYYKIPTD
jgi:hypothetical protein